MLQSLGSHSSAFPLQPPDSYYRASVNWRVVAMSLIHPSHSQPAEASSHPQWARPSKRESQLWDASPAAQHLAAWMVRQGLLSQQMLFHAQLPLQSPTSCWFMHSLWIFKTITFSSYSLIKASFHRGRKKQFSGPHLLVKAAREKGQWIRGIMHCCEKQSQLTFSFLQRGPSGWPLCLQLREIKCKLASCPWWLALPGLHYHSSLFCAPATFHCGDTSCVPSSLHCVFLPLTVRSSILSSAESSSFCPSRWAAALSSHEIGRSLGGYSVD